MIQAKGLWLSVWLGIVAITLGSCRKDNDGFPLPDALEGYSFSLSTDTLWLDTIPSLYLSSTYGVRVYNPSNSPLTLSSVGLRGGTLRGFRLNVDGSSGDTHRQVRIEARDSIQIFLRTYLPETNRDLPEQVLDTLELADPNGQVYRLPIIATRQNVHRLTDHQLTSDLTLGSARPLLIQDSLIVHPGATLRLQAPQQIWLGANAYIRIGGRLIASGTAEHPILLSGIRRDKLLPSVPYSRVPGQWGGVIVDGGGRVELEHLRLHNGKWGLYFSERTATDTQPVAILDHCQLTNLSGIGLRAVGGHYIIRDSELSNTLGATLYLQGGRYDLERSSLINLYPWQGIRTSSTLVYRETLADDSMSPEESYLRLDHCVVDGSMAVVERTTGGERRQTGGELDVALSSPTSRALRVQRSWLRSVDYSRTLEGILWQTSLAKASDLASRIYIYVGVDGDGRRDYRYDLRPRAEAPFVGMGGDGSGYTDLNGRRRSSPMTLGAYEYSE